MSIQGASSQAHKHWSVHIRAAPEVQSIVSRVRCYSLLGMFIASLIVLAAGCNNSSVIVLPPPPGMPGPPWFGYANNAQHSADSLVASQGIAHIHWRTPVDLAPPYSGGELFIHYGSATITHNDTVIVPVKTNASGSFRVEAHSASSGALIWKVASDYVLPAFHIPYLWVPSFSPAIDPSGRLYFAGSGGKLLYRDNPDAATGSLKSIVFYGNAEYAAHKAAYNAAVKISTPITIDSNGDIFFGFLVSGATHANLKSGIARIAANGTGSWVSAAAAAGDATMTQVQTNSAPALSPDLSTLYVAVHVTPDLNGFASSGDLVAVDSTTLATKHSVQLLDPFTNAPGILTDSSTASPTVGPDGDVYFGVLETNCCSEHNDRGWLLHYDATLSTTKIPGSFGWDDTVAIVPASMVPSYTGASAYLLMTKYNNYIDTGTGDGMNRIAILDPNATEADPVISSVMVMNEVMTHLGVTPDPRGGFREWCINSAVVDPATKSIYANSEDGSLYRWDLTNNTFSQSIGLTSGVGEAYTPTVIGADGQVYAINNAVLFALGQ